MIARIWAKFLDWWGRLFGGNDEPPDKIYPLW